LPTDQQPGWHKETNGFPNFEARAKKIR